MKKYRRKTIGFLDGQQAFFARRYVDGGGESPPAPASETPPANPPVTAPAEPPAKPAPTATLPADPTSGKPYTEEQLKAEREKAVADYKQHLEEARDYEKMTPEEKVAFLERQRDEDKLSAKAVEKLSKADLSPDFLPFIRGKDEADTDERLKNFKAAYDKDVQKAVEKRMKGSGYLPRGSAAGTTGDENKKRSRGVTFNN